MGAMKQAVRPAWVSALQAYGHSDQRRAITQLVDTLVPYGALWAAMILTIKMGWSPLITIALGVVASAFLVRTFIIFHDCCHGSFFTSRKANRIWGTITGILTLTPYDDWRLSHAKHHATAGDLDNRGTGDVWTMTVAEYRASTPRQRLGYRLYRHPLVMFVLGPLLSFVISPRFAGRKTAPRARQSIAITNLALLALAILGGLTIGWAIYPVLQIGIMWFAGIFGIWLFYVQHQFEGVYWARHDEWNRHRAAMEGSSHYHLPRVLQWFSGYIGYHHIHHLRATIPNYHLRACHEAIPEAQVCTRLTLRTSLRCLGLALYDEYQHRLIRFRDLNNY